MGWKILKHNGLHFPYKYMYQNIKIVFKLKHYTINPQLEEAIFHFLKSKFKEDDVFSSNFLHSIRKYLPKELSNIKNIHDLNLNQFKNKQCIIKINKTNINKYKFCTINGKTEELSKYVPEPACIFNGRGNHPLRGTFKESIQPINVIINISKNICIDNQSKYKKIIQNKSVNWIACWKDVISNKYKYIYPSSHADIQTISSQKKFNFARSLSKKIKLIQKNYMNDIQKGNEHGLCTYCIDNFCLRCGTETDEDRTFGCTTLKQKHISFDGFNLTFCFNGKDSILFNKTFIVSPIIKQAFMKILKNKKKDDDLFTNVNSVSLNSYLNSLMPNLTAKVFRTYHASLLMYKMLNKKSDNKYKQFLNANVKVAALCNHTNNSTSKTNYIDPRVIVSYCSRNNVEIKKCLSASLLKKYEWALSTPIKFKY